MIAAVEIHRAVNQSKERVVLTNSYAITGIVMGAALANNNVAGLHLLATPDLHAKSLGCTNSVPPC